VSSGARSRLPARSRRCCSSCVPRAPSPGFGATRDAWPRHPACCLVLFFPVVRARVLVAKRGLMQQKMLLKSGWYFPCIYYEGSYTGAPISNVDGDRVATDCSRWKPASANSAVNSDNVRSRPPVITSIVISLRLISLRLGWVNNRSMTISRPEVPMTDRQARRMAQTSASSSSISLAERSARRSQRTRATRQRRYNECGYGMDLESWACIFGDI
jgi:hypothetical protein